MGQRRDLLPVTVYLTPEAKALAEARAASFMISTAALLRQIIMGLENPLDRASGAASPPR